MVEPRPSYPTAVETATAATRWRPLQSPLEGSSSPGSIALDSFRRPVRGMHALWIEALATMDSEQVNHFERPGVLPIAFTVHHQPRMEDFAVALLGGLTS